MDEDLDERAGWGCGEIDDGRACGVPASGCEATAFAVEGGELADAPQVHLGEHAVFDLDENLFDHAAADLGAEHGEGGAVFEALFGFVEPGAGAVGIAEDGDGMIEDADEAGEFVGLVAGEGFAAGAAVLEGTGGDDDVVEVFERHSGFGNELGHGGDGDAGFYVLQVEVEGGEEGLGGERFGGGGHEDIMP